MTRKRRRLWVVLACGVGLGSAAALSLSALGGNLVFFMAPTQIEADLPPPSRTIRLGGMVVAGSVRQSRVAGQEPAVQFSVTDGQQAIAVRYVGILPDLFREGQSVVALGEMGRDGCFAASEVLAKHDETYMPKEVAAALRRSGRWDPRFGPAPNAAAWNAMTAARPTTRGS